MKTISIRTWSHLSAPQNTRNDNATIRSSKAADIHSFPELVSEIAAIAFHNPRFSLFFRGQVKDHIDNKGRSTIYPEIYRDIKTERSWHSNELKSRFDILTRASESILPGMIDIDDGRGIQQIARFPEVGWAILQHYDICPTPLIDVTHSLRVAASFAKPNNDTPDGYVFVLGLPHANGSITYSVEDELLYIKLLSIAPPAAMRPHFQEGFLLGSFPSSKTSVSAEYDAGRRLIAKYRITGNKFWTDDFPPIPLAALYPTGDPFEGVARATRDELLLPPPIKMTISDD